MTVVAYRTVTESTSGRFQKPDGSWWETYYEGDHYPENRREREVPAPRTVRYPDPTGEVRGTINFQVEVDAPVEIGTISAREAECVIRALRAWAILSSPSLDARRGVLPDYIAAVSLLTRLGVAPEEAIL